MPLKALHGSDLCETIDPLSLCEPDKPCKPWQEPSSLLQSRLKSKGNLAMTETLCNKPAGGALTFQIICSNPFTDNLAFVKYIKIVCPRPPLFHYSCFLCDDFFLLPDSYLVQVQSPVSVTPPQLHSASLGLQLCWALWTSPLRLQWVWSEYYWCQTEPVRFGWGCCIIHWEGMNELMNSN